MPAGRKPKPTNLKILTGNPGKRPLNMNEPTYEIGVGKPPTHLDDEAKKEWKRVGKLLTSARVVTQADRAILALYCVAWSRWVKAELLLQKYGDVLKSSEGGTYQNPYLAVANRASENMVRAAALLGLDPSSRSRLAIDRGGEGKTKIPTAPRVFPGDEEFG